MNQQIENHIKNRGQFIVNGYLRRVNNLEESYENGDLQQWQYGDAVRKAKWYLEQDMRLLSEQVSRAAGEEVEVSYDEHRSFHAVVVAR